MNITSIARFALVCLLFVLFYHFTAFCTVIWLSLPILSDFFKWINTEFDPAPPANAYDQVKDAFEEIFATI